MDHMKRKTNHLIIIIICFVMAFTCIPAITGTGEADAASKRTKTTILYSNVIIEGSTAYCMVGGFMDKYLYKVDVNSGSCKKIAYSGMRLKGMTFNKGYIYYGEVDGDLPLAHLQRINVKTGKKNKLASTCVSKKKELPIFSVGKNKIYYKSARFIEKKFKVVGSYKKMKKNGKGKRPLKNVKIKMKCKKTNRTGYELVYVGKDRHYDSDSEQYEYRYHNCYLQKPDGDQIFIAKVYDYWDY